MDGWLDTDEKEEAALALIGRLWRERLPHYRELLESAVFQYLHEDSHGS